MKRKITFHAFMAFILILVAFGCRQEHEVVKAQIATNAKIFRKPLEELPEIQKSVKKIEENLKKVKQTGKTVADYNVDTENVLVMSFDDKSTAYSLIIENADIDVADPYYVENINIYNDGTNDFQYITRYVPSDGLPFYSYSAFNGEVQFYDIDHNFLFSKSTTDISCTTCRQMAFSLGCYDYVINDNAGYWQIQSVSNHCGGSSTPPNGGSTGSSGSSGSGTGDTSGSSGTGGTGGSSGGYSAPTNPYIPNIPTQDAIEAKFYKNFLSNLNMDQYNFLGHNQDYNDEVFNYLSSNNFSVDSKSFMKWGISFFVQNTDSAGTCNVSWGEFQNWFVDGDGLTSELMTEFLSDLNNPNIVKPTKKLKNNALVNCIFNKAKSAPNFQQYLQNFDGRFSTAHLLLDLKPLSDSSNAQTSPPDGYWINITINSNNLNRPSLDIARTFMHEMIHAEMFRILLSLAPTSNGQIDVAELTNMLNTHNYPGIYDYFRRFGLNNMQHEQMAAHYIGIIKNYLKQIDGSITDSQAEAMAWIGLQNTVAWNNLGTTKQNELLNTYNSWKNTASHSCP